MIASPAKEARENIKALIAWSAACVDVSKVARRCR
jgi:hypothetical protein